MEKGDKGLDSIEMAQLAREDQGRHEVEVCCGDEEADLHHHLNLCKKNPGHLNFIPVHKFTIDYLPSAFKHPYVFETIKSFSHVSVRLSVHGTSMERPKNYPFSRYAGRPIRRFGSGLVYTDTFSSNEPVACTLPDCPQKDPHNEYGHIIITTAAHVVFDEFEAKNTVVDFFFDDEDDRSSIVTARGIGVLNVDHKIDRTLVNCVTHDKDLIGRLTALATSYSQLCQRWVLDKFDDIDLSQFVAVVSHPHGKSKQVSVGRIRVLPLYPDTCYDAATCPGSSGAPVLKFSHKQWRGLPVAALFYGHSGCNEFGYNQASPGLPSYFS